MSNPLLLALNSRGIEVRIFKKNLAKIGYIIPMNELDEQVFGIGTQDALLKLQAKYGLSRTGKLDDATKAALDGAVAVAGTDHKQVEGRIFFDYGLPDKGCCSERLW